ncbi:unnamed protein product, partial [marine sediment metagenome]
MKQSSQQIIDECSSELDEKYNTRAILFKQVRKRMSKEDLEMLNTHTIKREVNKNNVNNR